MYINLKIKKPLFIVFTSILICIFIFSIYLTPNIIFSAVSDSEDTIKLPIIMYHSILKSNKQKSKFIISPDTFENDLKYIKNNGYTTIVMKDLIDYIYENKELPDKPIIITFDDGYYNNYLYAFPLLKQYDCKMVLSPIGKQCDIYSEISDTSPNYAHCSWDILKEMKDSGLVEIQNHSYNMHTITKARCGTKKNKNESFENYQQAFSSDVTLMQNKTEDYLNTTPDTFVFPFGAISNCSIDILRQLGFKATLSCEGKINKITKNPDNLYGLCRVLRPPNISSENFFKNKIEK